MNNVVMDDRTISMLLSQIETLIDTSRSKVDAIVSKYDSIESHTTLMQSKDLLKQYGDTADDFSKICFIMQGTVDAIMDVKSIRRAISSDSSTLVPTMVKTYKYRAESLIDRLNDLKESCGYAKTGMEARVKYMSSCSYMGYDKYVKGAQC